MIFHSTPLAGVWRIELERHADERGSFARTFCRDEFAAHGLVPEVAQCNLSTNHRRGTLRGMHYQAPPHAEAKLVRCVRGALFDVVVDVRPGSPTEGEHYTVVLEAGGDRGDGEDGGRRPATQLYIPPGCAHGFQTLVDDTEIFYQMSATYAPAAARGFRWDDPEIGIPWPEPVTVISDRDRALPPYAHRDD